MTRILVMSETLPLAQVKSKFSEMVDRVEHTHDRIIVTRNGRPAAVMICPASLGRNLYERIARTGKSAPWFWAKLRKSDDLHLHFPSRPTLSLTECV